MEIMNCSVQVQPQNNYVLYLPCSLFGLVFCFCFPFCWQPVEVEHGGRAMMEEIGREKQRERERNVKRERESQIFGFRDKFRV